MDSSMSSGRPRKRSRRMPGARISPRTRARLPIGLIPGCAAIARKRNLRIERGEVRPSPTQPCWLCPPSPAVQERDSKPRSQSPSPAPWHRVPSVARRVRVLCLASARLVGFAGLILLLVAGAAPASADDFAALVGGLAGDSFAEEQRAVVALGTLGDARAIPILQALADERLLKGSDARIAISATDGGTARVRDAVTGADIPDIDLPGFGRIIVNNRLRGAI